MSGPLEDSIKRWTAKRKSTLFIEIIQGKTTVAEASWSYDMTPSEIENWVDDARKGMKNALKANPLDVRQQYEKQLRNLQEAYGEAVIPPFLTGSKSRIYAAFSFWIGVMPPMPMFGRSLLYVQSQRVA